MSEKFTIGGFKSKSEHSAMSTNRDQFYKVAIVAGKFNSHISKNLVEGAQETLAAAGIENVPIYWVPGAFEIPLTCDRLLKGKDLDGIITLGAVIRGDTPHFDYVAGEAAKGVGAVALKHQKPVIFGVLTTNTVEQALNRAGLKLGNKGSEAAAALIELLNLYSENNI